MFKFYWKYLFMGSPELKKVYLQNVCSYILNFYMSVCNTVQKKISIEFATNIQLGQYRCKKSIFGKFENQHIFNQINPKNLFL